MATIPRVRAVVTGSSGFVGRHLVAHLEEAGDSVVPADREHGVDICDPATVERLLSGHRPEAVYHLAGWSDVGASWNHPREAFRVNAEGTLVVLEAARSLPRPPRVLVVSSAEVYGPPRGAEPFTEDHPIRPVSPYAASKVAADALALQAHLGHGLETIRVRAFNHLGPGQSDRFVAAALAARIAAAERDGSDEVPVGNLDAARDFTDVRDVVRAYRMLIERGRPGEVYNVCSGRAVTIRELAERMVSLAHRPLRLVVDERLFRPVDVPVVVGDATRIRTEVGWEPRIPLERTLADVLADWRARLRSPAPPA